MNRNQDLKVSNLTIEPTRNTDTSLTISGIANFNSNININSNTTISNNLTVGGNTSIIGNLTVQGTTTTIQSVTTVYTDPILQIGGTVAPSSDDSKDRGISFYYYNNGAKKGFLGYDKSEDGFIFKTTATINEEVVSGSNANIVCGDINASIATLTGDLIVNGGDITNATPSTNVNVFTTTTGLLTLGGGSVNIGATGGTSTVKGTLNVDEAVTFDTTLGVTGLTTLTSNLIVNNVNVGETITSNGAIYSKSILNSFGCKQIQSFNISLEGIDGSVTSYDNSNVFVKLGELYNFLPTVHNQGTDRFFIEKVFIGIKVAAGANISANMYLSSNTNITVNELINGNEIEIVGNGVSSFDMNTSTQSAAAEIDIDMNAAPGLFHIFYPSVSVPISNKYLYLCAGSTMTSNVTLGRATVIMEYLTF